MFAFKMKRKIIFFLLGLLLLVVGFIMGSFFQHLRSGYRYEVRDTKEYSFPVGPVRWSYIYESVGISVLDPGATILEFDGRVIYKAKRSFAESVPYAQNIVATPGGLAWDDGEFQFGLAIDQIDVLDKEGGEEQSDVADAAKPQLEPRGRYSRLNVDGTLSPHGSMWFGDEGVGTVRVYRGGEEAIGWSMLDGDLLVESEDENGEDVFSYFTVESAKTLVKPDGEEWMWHED